MTQAALRSRPFFGCLAYWNASCTFDEQHSCHIERWKRCVLKPQIGMVARRRREHRLTRQCISYLRQQKVVLRSVLVDKECPDSHAFDAPPLSSIIYPTHLGFPRILYQGFPASTLLHVHAYLLLDCDTPVTHKSGLAKLFQRLQASLRVGAVTMRRVRLRLLSLNLYPDSHTMCFRPMPRWS